MIPLVVCFNNRYVQLNIQYSEAYRKYNVALPAFLRNRPREFVQHVCHRWTASHEFTADDISDTGAKVFHVRSPDSGNVYNVRLGSDDDMPSCGCEDWRRYHWPCKHFCAIFQLTSYGWNELGGCYRDSPFFTIDDGVLRAQPGSLQVSHGLTEDSTPPTADIESVTQPISDDSQSVERCAMECRQTMRQLTDATYLCVEQKPLQQLLSTLQDALVSIRPNLPADAELALNVKPAMTKTKRKCLAADRLGSTPPLRRRRLLRRAQMQPEPVLQSADVEETILGEEESELQTVDAPESCSAVDVTPGEKTGKWLSRKCRTFNTMIAFKQCENCTKITGGGQIWGDAPQAPRGYGLWRGGAWGGAVHHGALTGG